MAGAMRQLLGVLCLSAIASTGATAAVVAADERVDIAVVVSLDRSESISVEEAKAQITGLIYTLEHPRFLNAVRSGRLGRLGLSVVAWSSFARTEVVLPWIAIGGGDDARRAAAVLAKDLERDREVTHGTQTDVAMGISVATAQMAELPWPADQRVINMVGDGISNIGRVAVVDRDVAVASGITINALVTAQGSAIRILKEYFRREVIGGPTAFVQLTNGDEDFADAMLRKMLLEIALLNHADRFDRWGSDRRVIGKVN